MEQNPVFYTAVDQGAVSEGVFDFKLASSGSEVYIGGTDSRLSTGSIEYSELVNDQLWQVGGATLTLNGDKVPPRFETIIDSGTTLMGAETETLEINWGGKTWPDDTDNFNLRK
ncbi:hypothetical protein DICSQDRAFT_174687 [Dichomitus squalens LYAD-421 SS1]|uniref:Peptidase A1 domain-containing protein n=2 Tax=Dichomitus squalens TaxID=114155 RepID=A0A4Q9M862_9APHY|nr:uncharacterized protein DICSQDRAFT_174687 [Dichomitus squalens LYAD-421 SS1]EJF56644.1 hypothetical protein DICSQDRAFT_174687 [Dichomitus squalens LYAD-421 SS1]TBU23260.1 hypothetical protein BD311DRAFT_791763 [Dichomitus squalens]